MKGCEHCEDSANKIAELELQLEEMSALASQTQEQLDEMGKRRRKAEGRMLELEAVLVQSQSEHTALQHQLDEEHTALQDQLAQHSLLQHQLVDEQAALQHQLAVQTEQEHQFNSDKCEWDQKGTEYAQTITDLENVLAADIETHDSLQQGLVNAGQL